MVDFDEKTDPATNGTDDLTQAALIGAGLKEVRERLGWKLPDVAESIRIRSIFLNAIESGNLSSLPGTAYRIGFVRAYAQALGLDGEEILQRFRNAGQIEEPEKAGIKLLAPVPDRGVPKGALILIAFIVAIGGYGLWYYHTEQTRKVAQSALQIPTKLQPLAAPPKVTPALPSPGDTSSTTAAPKASQPSTMTTSAAPTTATSPSVATTATPATQSNTVSIAPASTVPTTQPGTQPASPASTPNNAAPTQASAAPNATGMVITATQPSWIQVTAPNGTILFSKVLNAGQSWPVPQMANLKMTTGNAGGTVISVDGKPEQSLGADGVVLHGYQLTPPAQGSDAPTTSSTTTTATP